MNFEPRLLVTHDGGCDPATPEHLRVKSGLDLHDSRIDAVNIFDGDAHVHFSHAYIHKSKGTPGRDPGTGWSQAAVLVISGAAVGAPAPPFPNMICDGHLAVGGIKHTLLPLPFTRKVDVNLSLIFTDGTALNIHGRGATVALLGQAIYLEDF